MCFIPQNITNYELNINESRLKIEFENMKFVRKSSKKYSIQLPETKRTTSRRKFILWATCIALIIFFCFGIGLVIYYHGLQSSITDAETNSSSTTSSSKIPDCNLKEGKYVRKPAENDWHHVTISKMSNGNYKWKNKDGVEWDLISNGQECNLLQVGTQCPYYVNGYTFTRFNENGIYGPDDEFYEYQGMLCLVNFTSVNHT